MSAEIGLRAMLPGRRMPVDGTPRPMIPLPSDLSLQSAGSASARIANLVRRALRFFETDRLAARSCLIDASSLLGMAADESEHGAAPFQSALRRGGLAVWQGRRTVAYIDAHLESKMAILDMAHMVTLSKSHFSRAFKQSLGMSPMAYIAERRVERAKLMMASTDGRLTEIALACGFADQSHLNRCFRRMVGMSPGSWRRMCQYETRANELYEPRRQ